jgi:hypothetical protein
MSLSGVSALDHGQLPPALFRIVIGRHFLYEGWTRLALAGSSSYLRISAGPFAGFFQWLGYVRKVDLLNDWAPDPANCAAPSGTPENPGFHEDSIPLFEVNGCSNRGPVDTRKDGVSIAANTTGRRGSRPEGSSSRSHLFLFGVTRAAIVEERGAQASSKSSPKYRGVAAACCRFLYPAEEVEPVAEVRGSYPGGLRFGPFLNSRGKQARPQGNGDARNKYPHADYKPYIHWTTYLSFKHHVYVANGGLRQSDTARTPSYARLTSLLRASRKKGK